MENGSHVHDFELKKNRVYFHLLPLPYHLCGVEEHELLTDSQSEDEESRPDPFLQGGLRSRKVSPPTPLSLHEDPELELVVGGDVPVRRGTVVGSQGLVPADKAPPVSDLGGPVPFSITTTTASSAAPSASEKTLAPLVDAVVVDSEFRDLKALVIDEVSNPVQEGPEEERGEEEELLKKKKKKKNLSNEEGAAASAAAAAETPFPDAKEEEEVVEVVVVDIIDSKAEGSQPQVSETVEVEVTSTTLPHLVGGVILPAEEVPFAHPAKPLLPPKARYRRHLDEIAVGMDKQKEEEEPMSCDDDPGTDVEEVEDEEDEEEEEEVEEEKEEEEAEEERERRLRKYKRKRLE